MKIPPEAIEAALAAPLNYDDAKEDVAAVITEALPHLRIAILEEEAERFERRATTPLAEALTETYEKMCMRASARLTARELRARIETLKKSKRGKKR